MRRIYGDKWACHSRQRSAVSWLKPRHCELLGLNVVELPDECLVTMSLTDDRSTGQGGADDGGQAGHMHRLSSLSKRDADSKLGLAATAFRCHAL